MDINYLYISFKEGIIQYTIINKYDSFWFRNIFNSNKQQLEINHSGFLLPFDRNTFNIGCIHNLSHS